jgi:hypothetical protein
MQVNVDLLIKFLDPENTEDILSVCGIDLHDTRTDAKAECEWHEGSEDKWWTIKASQLNLTECFAVRWTVADGTGVDDVEIFERTADLSREEEAAELLEWLEDVAGEIATLGLVRNGTSQITWRKQ